MEDHGVDLEKFVSQALIRIKAGVQQAQNQEVAVAPMRLSGSGGTGRAGEMQSTATRVEFDVAVNASTSDESKSGLGLFVAPFGAGAQDKKQTTDETTNRIKFSVVVDLAQSS